MGRMRLRKSLRPPRFLLLALLLPLSSLLAADPLSIAYDIHQADLIISAEKPLQGLGWEVYTLGDVNGDGYDDIAFFGGREPTFHAYILYGSETMPASLDLEGFQIWGTRLESTSRDIWCVPSPVGDVNGDGFDDMAFRHCEVTLFWTGVGIILGDTEAITVLYGARDMPPVIDIDTMADGSSGFLLLPVDDAPSNRFAGIPSHADINGDGFSDILLAAPGAVVSETPDSGLVHVVFGAHELPARVSLAQLGAEVAGTTFSLSSPLRWPQGKPLRFGKSMGAAADINHDGFADILVSAPGWEGEDLESHWDGGAVALIYGKRGFPAQVDLIDPKVGRVLFYSAVGGAGLLQTPNFLGSQYVRSTGDFDGDGKAEILCSSTSRQYAPGSVAPYGFLLVCPRSSPPEIEVNAQVVLSAISPARTGPQVENVIPVPDFNGDGLGDLLVAVPDYSPTHPMFGGLGAAYLLLGRTDPPDILVLSESPRHTVQFLSPDAFSLLGTAIASADLNGDSFSDVVIAAPGHTHDRYTAHSIGRIFIILGTPDLREPPSLSRFFPPVGPTSGGQRVTFYGQGFTSETRIFFGAHEATEYRRIDSRWIVAKSPPGDLPGPVPVRVVTGPWEGQYDTSFGYEDRHLPLVAKFEELGDYLITIPRESTDIPTYFKGYLSRAGDVTGDRIDDLLFSTDGSLRTTRLERVYVLRGGAHLPSVIPQGRLPEYGSAFFLPEERMDLGYAQGVGDVDGDGIADIAAFARGLKEVYIILGGRFSDGEHEIYEMYDAGAVLVITEADLSYGPIVPLGDVNADGFADFALVDFYGRGFDGHLGTVALVLGGDSLPQDMHYTDLPMIIGRVPPGGYYSRCRVKGIGDADGDGFDDIAFITYLLSDDKESEGDQTFYDIDVVFGRPAFAHRSRMEDELKAHTAIRVAYCDEHDPAGAMRYSCLDLSTAGDVNEDGYGDFILLLRGYYNSDWGVYMIHGAPRIRFPHDRRLGKLEEFDGAVMWDPDYNAPQSIASVDGGGDFNADERPDFLIAEPMYGARRSLGRLFMVFDATLDERTYLLGQIANGSLPGMVVEKTGGDVWPRGPHFVGDLNDDGFEDIAAGDKAYMTIWLNPNGSPVKQPDFVRGDINGDGIRDIGDAIFGLTYLFVDGSVPPCLDSADTNDSGHIDLSDPIHLLNWMFAGGNPPAIPSMACGPDPTADDLSCISSRCP